MPWFPGWYLAGPFFPPWVFFDFDLDFDFDFWREGGGGEGVREGEVEVESSRLHLFGFWTARGVDALFDMGFGEGKS
jgi:hypothetical protein